MFNHRVAFRAAFLLPLLIALMLLPAGGATCGGRKIRQDSPTKMVIAAPQEERTGDTATEARNYIYSLVPAAFQPRDAKIRIRVLDSKPLAELRMRDKLSPMDSPPYGITGYTLFPANNPDEQTDVTNIYLVPHRSDEAIAKTAVHEFGHFVYWLQLTEEERARWVLVWQSARERNTLPSAYAATSQFEGFADSFAFWCVGQIKDPALTAYFDALKKAR